MTIPDGLKDRVENAVRNRIENEAAFKRIADIEEVIKRVDLRWEEGFINKDEHLEKRRQMQQELDSLRPIDYDELTEASDLLSNFRFYWNECAAQANPDEARRQLLDKIVDRVFVHNRQVLALVIHGSFAVVLDQNETAPTVVVDAVQAVLLSEGITLNLGDSQHGSDGDRCRTCYLWSAFKIDYHIVVKYWLEQTINVKCLDTQSNNTSTLNNTSKLSPAQIETTT